MARTDHSRTRRSWGAAAQQHADRAPRHQPRPAPRRTGTRRGVVALAVREG